MGPPEHNSLIGYLLPYRLFHRRLLEVYTDYEVLRTLIQFVHVAWQYKPIRGLCSGSPIVSRSGVGAGVCRTSDWTVC